MSAVMQPMGYLSAHQPPVSVRHGLRRSFAAWGRAHRGPLLGVARYLTDRGSDEWRTVRAELGLPPVTTAPAVGRAALAESVPWSLPAPARLAATRLAVASPCHRIPVLQPALPRLDPELDDFWPTGDPPIVFTLGTTAVNDPGSFYEESVAAVRRLGRRAVLLVGRRNGNADPLPLARRHGGGVRPT